MADETSAPEVVTDEAWVKQEDGTYLPSASLAEKIRSNPDQYPNAAADIATVSGMSQEEVQSALDNPLRPGGWLSLVGKEMHVRAATGVVEGMGEAYSWVARNAGEVTGSETLKKAGEFIKQATDLNPGFDTEESSLEKAGEVVGQAGPAVATGVVASGPGLLGFLTGAAVSGTVGVATFDPREKTIIDQIDSVVPLGPLKDSLEITDKDDTKTALFKQFVAGALLEAGLVGSVKAIKALHGLIPKGPKALKEAQKIAEEITKEQPSSAVAPAGVTPAIKEAQKIPTEKLRETLKADAKAQLLRRAQDVVNGEPSAVAPVNGAKEAFIETIFRPVKRLSERNLETGVSKTSKLSSQRISELSYHADKVFDAVHRGETDEVLKLLRKGAAHKGTLTTDETSFTQLYNASVTKAVLNRMSDSMDAVVEAIRKDPSLKTEVVWKELAADYLQQTGEVGQIYRSIGSSASYQQLLRKSNTFTDGEVTDFLKADESFTKELEAVGIKSPEEGLDDGIGLYEGKSTFVAKKVLALSDAGINPAEVLDDLYKQFDDFDRLVAGKRANIAGTQVALTAEEKATAIGRWVQMLKDIQATMLLGQLMTSGTEIVTTGLNVSLTPMLRRLGGGPNGRIASEYAGYAYAFNFSRNMALKAFKTGKGVVDNWDIKEGTYTAALDYANMPKHTAHLWRLFKFAVDLSIGSAEFFKATRAYGTAYADALQAAKASGLKGKAAVEKAKQFARSRFTPEGLIKDEDLRVRMAEGAFQQAFDGSTLTGRLGQWVEDIRNSDAAGGVVSVVSRGMLPFFRTLANIGGNGAQFIMPPGSALALKRVLPEGTGLARFIDDFSGKNGEIARQTAIGRQRMGMGLAATAYAMAESGLVEITGPSRGQRYDAKKRAFEEYPASSLIVGNTAVDLSRFLPFSAPLMLTGTLRDYQMEDRLRMEGGEYDPEDGTLETLARSGQAWAVTAALLLQDAGASRGVFDLFDAVNKAMTEGNTDALKRYSQQYATQFTPGPVKMALKAGGGVQYEGYTFLERWQASAGFRTDWERLDFLGKPISFPTLKGVDPSNRRILRLDDPVYREFAALNKFEGLALKLPKPDRVFNNGFWRGLGIDAEGPLGVDTPTLTDMKTKDGTNAWKAYRTLVYKGTVKEDTSVSTGRYGDRVNVGSVKLKAGETLEQSIRRLIELPGYRKYTSDARKKLWDAVYGYYKKQAKDYLKAELVVEPSQFNRSRYGTTLKEPTSLSEASKAQKTLAGEVQTSRGSPLDELFQIK